MSLLELKLSLWVLAVIQITLSQFMYDAIQEPIARPIAASKYNYWMYDAL